jgi:hypothetical protein
MHPLHLMDSGIDGLEQKALAVKIRTTYLDEYGKDMN